MKRFMGFIRGTYLFAILLAPHWIALENDWGWGAWLLVAVTWTLFIGPLCFALSMLFLLSILCPRKRREEILDDMFKSKEEREAEERARKSEVRQ